MISPISSVRFCGNTPEVNPLERKGAYTKPDIPTKTAEPPVKKKSHALRNTIIGLVVAAGALVTANKMNWLKAIPTEDLADAKLLQKAGHYLAKAGETISKYTYDPVVKYVGKGIEWAKGFIKKPAA